MQRVIAIIISCCFILSVKGDIITDYATGKSTDNLMITLCELCHPTNIHTDMTQSEMDAIMLRVYGVDNKTLLPDLLSPDATTVGNGTVSYTCHILSSWFNNDNTDKDLVAYDLYNIFPTTYSHLVDRGDLPLFDTKENNTGVGTTTDGKYTAYNPTEQWKGALARMALYVATVYGQPSAWPGNGAIIFNDFQRFPLLSNRAITQFMSWHRSYPVTESELQRATVISSIQGNQNPFILHPELAEYIWGYNIGTPYLPPSDPDDPGSPDNPANPIPLHAIYTVNETIYLYSPYIDSDSQWTIDNRAISTASVRAIDLGVGIHELRFSNSRQSGKLTITIKQ